MSTPCITCAAITSVRRRPGLSVMGVTIARPADDKVFDHCIRTVRRLVGTEAPSCAAGVGRSPSVQNDWAVSAWWRARTGLAQKGRLDRDSVDPSNAALLRRLVDLCEKHECPVADWWNARGILVQHHPL